MPSERVLAFCLGFLLVLVAITYSAGRTPVVALVGVVVVTVMLILKQRSK